jgi:hypothetical protein
MENKIEIKEVKQEVEKIVFCRTNKGFGYKIVVDGKWFYISKAAISRVMKIGGTCMFETIIDKPVLEVAL